MKIPPLNDIIRLSTVVVHSGRYAYLQGTETEIKNHFLISKGNDETTIVTEEKNLPSTAFKRDNKWYKLFEIQASIPFQGVGFLATITKAI